MRMAKKTREPRTPMLQGLPATFAEAEKEQILNVMRDWPERMGEHLRAAGLGGSLDDPEVGHRLWQRKFETELASPDRDPDVLDSICFLAERGIGSAQRAMWKHAKNLLQDPKADLPAS